ncbi:putative proteinDPH-DEPENDENT ALDEHYDE REDUCTASE-LIKE PROTEIN CHLOROPLASTIC-RELATED [Salix purpurea]|uniref:Uncharacterized protein n=1 Tax=Salix purpurea TaxID=77065 RepID=A0A9Q0W9H5_SALPP|nr:putative proteinDPH-DEPENDENT ALDEHYDE REDUCTASE-LIKE PROTEIN CHLOROPLASTIC-RELATED [Salix purpurea]
MTTPTTPTLPLPLQDRVAIVTGSSRGIGKAIAIHLASLGARLVINYTSNKEQADLVANDINSSCADSTPRAIVAQANVSDPAQVKFLFDEAERVFGSQLHVLVNCAGVLDPKYPSISNTSLEDFDHIFSVNTRGAFLCCKEAANRLKTWWWWSNNIVIIIYGWWTEAWVWGICSIKGCSGDNDKDIS